MTALSWLKCLLQGAVPVSLSWMNLFFTLLLLGLHGIKALFRTASVQRWLLAHPTALFIDKFCHTDLSSDQKIKHYLTPSSSLYPHSSWQWPAIAIPPLTQAKQKLWRQGWHRRPQPLSASCRKPITFTQPQKAGRGAAISQPASQLSVSKPPIPIYFSWAILTYPLPHSPTATTSWIYQHKILKSATS